MSKLRDQTLALAAMFQSAVTIETLAAHGEIERCAFDCSFESLFAFDAATTESIYGDLQGLQTGFSALIGNLAGQPGGTGKNVAYYLFSMLSISAGLAKNNAMATEIHDRLQAMETRAEEFQMNRSSLVAKIDGLYQETISTLKPRIIVRGEQVYLRDSDNAARIRVLLLAGIRAAILWRQLGGNRWRLIFYRKKYVALAREMQRLNQNISD